MGSRQSPIHSVPGAGWPADSALGLAKDEAFRVTSLLNVIAKPALIGWAGKQEGLAYEAALRETILAQPKMLAMLPAELLNTMAGCDKWMGEFLDAVRERKGKMKAAEKKQVEASDIGTACHLWIEWWARKELGQKVREPQVNGTTAMLRDAFIEWADRAEFRPLYVEEKVWSIEHRWAGSLDLAGTIGGEDFTVIDIKSSSGIWPEQKMQVAAYCLGANELFGRGLPVGRIIRLPKTEADYEKLIGLTGEPYEERIIDGEDVITLYQAFLAAKDLYESMKRIQGMEE